MPFVPLSAPRFPAASFPENPEPARPLDEAPHIPSPSGSPFYYSFRRRKFYSRLLGLAHRTGLLLMPLPLPHALPSHLPPSTSKGRPGSTDRETAPAPVPCRCPSAFPPCCLKSTAPSCAALAAAG